MNTHSVYIQSLASIHPEGQSSDNRFIAVEPDYKRWITDPALSRRMSRVVKMGVAAGLQCLQSSDARVDAIITATGWGCLADTEKFLKSIAAQNEDLLSPTPFIQSTFNTIGGQIALISGNRAYNTTYVHRAFSFESALLDAILLLQSGEAERVLLGGIDESTPTVAQILTRMGISRKQGIGEGATFFLLSRETKDRNAVQIIGLDMFSGNFSKAELDKKREAFLKKYDADGALIVSDDNYKSICGEYPTASAFGLWHACSLPTKDADHLLVCNTFLNNHTFILIKK